MQRKTRYTLIASIIALMIGCGYDDMTNYAEFEQNVEELGELAPSAISPDKLSQVPLCRNIDLPSQLVLSRQQIDQIIVVYEEGKILCSDQENHVVQKLHRLIGPSKNTTTGDDDPLPIKGTTAEGDDDPLPIKGYKQNQTDDRDDDPLPIKGIKTHIALGDDDPLPIKG